MNAATDAGQQLEIKKTWRYYLGLILFVLSMVLPLIVTTVANLLRLPPAISTALIGVSLAGGPEVLLIAAAAVMGKENLDHLFSSLGRWAKDLIKWDQVSAARYRVGVWMMVFSVLISVATYYIFAKDLVVGDQLGWAYYVTTGGDILFTISFFVLGSEFWAKLQALFQYNARLVAENSGHTGD